MTTKTLVQTTSVTQKQAVPTRTMTAAVGSVKILWIGRALTPLFHLARSILLRVHFTFSATAMSIPTAIRFAGAMPFATNQKIALRMMIAVPTRNALRHAVRGQVSAWRIVL